MFKPEVTSHSRFGVDAQSIYIGGHGFYDVSVSALAAVTKYFAGKTVAEVRKIMTRNYEDSEGFAADLAKVRRAELLFMAAEYPTIYLPTDPAKLGLVCEETGRYWVTEEHAESVANIRSAREAHARNTASIQSVPDAHGTPITIGSAVAGPHKRTGEVERFDTRGQDPFSPVDIERVTVWVRDAQGREYAFNGRALVVIEQADDRMPQPTEAQAGRCDATGAGHTFPEVPRYVTTSGTLFTLGGYVQCTRCLAVTHYTDLPEDYQNALRRHAGRTFAGKLTESFALWALESSGGAPDPDGLQVLQATRALGRQVFRARGSVVTVQWGGMDDESYDTTYTVTVGPAE